MLERITGRTEGWAAGMRLAALSLQGRDDPGQFVKELETGDSAITSYLVEEVLRQQPGTHTLTLASTNKFELHLLGLLPTATPRLPYVELDERELALIRSMLSWTSAESLVCAAAIDQSVSPGCTVIVV